MTHKTKKSSSISGTMRYVMEKEDAEVLFSQNMLGDTREEMVSEMRLTAKLAQLKDPAYHLMISWHPKDQVTNEQMAEVAQALVKALGLAEHHAVVVRHGDTEHPHLHMVANRVHPRHGRPRMDGKGNYRAWGPGLDGGVIAPVLRKFERKYDWTQVKSRNSLMPGDGEITGPEVSNAAYWKAKHSGQPLPKATLATWWLKDNRQAVEGLPRTVRQLFAVWRKAGKGDLECQWQMGELHRLGMGVEWSKGMELAWKTKAAAQGHSQARADVKALQQESVQVERVQAHPPQGLGGKGVSSEWHGPLGRARDEDDGDGLEDRGLWRR